MSPQTPERPGDPSTDTTLDGLPLFSSAHALAGDTSARRTSAAPAKEHPFHDAIEQVNAETFRAKTSVNALEPVDDPFAVELREQPKDSHDLSVSDLADVDWAQVRTLRLRVSERLMKSRDDAATRRLERDEHGQLAWDAIRTEISTLQIERARSGLDPLTLPEAEALGHATMDSIFGLGRLERYMHTDGLEDISVRGHDNVTLVYNDGRIEAGPPVADSDEDLLEDLQHIAATAAEGERPFSAARPSLDLSIGKEGHRLSASGWFVPRPAVTIRRQGFTDSDLSRLIELGAIDTTLAEFLSAAIKAGKSIVVAGLPSAGKTTMIRSLLHELDPNVAIATIETEYELALHNTPDRHRNVWAGQYRPGGEDGAGEVTLIHLIEKSLRQSVDRIVVGEVRGQEILAMFEAMQAGKGSVSTIHATSARDAIERIVTCAIKMPPSTEAFAYRQIAASIDIILHIKVLDERGIGGKKLRFVDGVITTFPQSDAPNGVGITDLFTPGADGRAIPTGNLPSWIDDLVLTGYDPSALENQHATWADELDSLMLRAHGGAA